MLRKIISMFGVMMSYLYPKALSDKMNLIRDVLYTEYNKRFFLTFGKDSLIEYNAASFVGLKYIKLGNRCRLGKNIRLTVWDTYYQQRFTPQIVIGDDCNIGAGSHITSCNGIFLGNHVLTGPNILITDNSHGNTELQQMLLAPVDRTLMSKGVVRICDNVWIGSGACIMPGVTIGKNSIVGANSVVTHDVPEFSVVAGIPARVIKSIEH